MERTLQNRDRLIIYKLPKTWSSLFNKTYMPKRYDIIVFSKEASSRFSQGTEKQLIKRVIGLPGDRVVVTKGRVTIYNQDHPNGYDPDKDQAYNKSFDRTDNEIDVTVDEGHVFVLGDNRANSLDSRIIGPVETEHIVGRLVLRIYPPNKFESF